MDEEFHNDVGRQRQLEEQIRQRKSSSSVIEYPTQQDVLVGRNKAIQDFSGNIRLNILIDKQRATYDEMNKAGKSTCIVEIIHTIHRMGGRFLKRVTRTTTNDAEKGGVTLSYWEEVDFTAAQKKVNNCFQSRKRLQTNRFGW